MIVTLQLYVIQNLHQNCSEGPLVSIKIFYKALIMEKEYDCDDQEEELSSRPPMCQPSWSVPFMEKKGSGPPLSPFLPVYKFVIVLEAWGVVAAS